MNYTFVSEIFEIDSDSLLFKKLGLFCFLQLLHFIIFNHIFFENTHL